MDEQITWYLYGGILLSHKMIQLLIPILTWINHRIIILSEKSQEKNNSIDWMITFIWRPFKKCYKFVVTKKRSVFAKRRRRSEGRSIRKEEFQRSMRKLWGVIDMFTLLAEIMVSQLHIYVKTSNYTLYLHFIICQLHLKKAVKNHIEKKIRYQGSMT